jgi:hypothetical protein
MFKIKISTKPKILVKTGFRFKHADGHIHTLTMYNGVFYKNNSDLFISDLGDAWSSAYLIEKIESGIFEFLGYEEDL